jgi:hypothetical protein
VNLAKFWENLTTAPALFAGLLLYSSEQGGGYAILRERNSLNRQLHQKTPINRRGLAMPNPAAQPCIERIYLLINL